MRLQPPKDQDRFIGKQINMELIREYIGNHRVIFYGGDEITFEEFIEEEESSPNEANEFLSLFPIELEYLAMKYIEDFYKRRNKK